MNTKTSFSQVYEDIRKMWAVYWSITDPIQRETCKQAIYSVTDTMVRMHGMISD